MRPKEKDKLWKRYKDLKGYIGDRMCTKSEMWKPTDHNVDKHIKETFLTNKAREEFKRIGKELGEPSNAETLRPRR